MLGELVEYARAMGLSAQPGFKAKKVRWTVVFDGQGTFIDVIDEGKEGRTFRVAPHLEQFELVSGEPRSHFLLDSAQVAVGLGAEPGSKHEAKGAFFMRLLTEAGAVVPEIGVCAAALADEGTRRELVARLLALKAKPIDSVTFRVGDTYLADSLDWHQWWVAFRRTLRPESKVENKSAATMLCLATGEESEPVKSHSKVDGMHVVGGQSSGTALVSFDKDAFGSYGLQGSENAACSAETVAAYRDALSDLVKRGTKLAGVICAHWYESTLPEEDDPFGWDPGESFLSPDADREVAAEKAKRLLTAIEAGRRPELTKRRYSVMMLSAAGGRIMVRDFFQGDFVELVTRYQDWFTDLSICPPSSGGADTPFSPRLYTIMSRLVRAEPRDGIRDRMQKELVALVPRLWRALILGGPLPDEVVAKALANVKAGIFQHDAGANGNLDRVACAILKAWYNRAHLAKVGGVALVEHSLSKDHPSTAYQCGRLMAVLASLQYAALGDVGAGVVQRYYSSASTTPSLVLGRLIRTAQYHLDKLDKGLAVWYEKLLGEVATKLGSSIPSTLGLEGQTLFALGYYQQKAALYAGKREDDGSVD